MDNFSEQKSPFFQKFFFEQTLFFASEKNV